MAYIYKKTIQGKPYYYLRISKRVDGKIVVNDVAYLGNEICNLYASMEKLPQEYKASIRKGYHNIKKFIESNHYLETARLEKLKSNEYMERQSLEKVEAARLHFTSHFLKLDKLTIKETYSHFLIDFAYNTTSIEGNTITLAEANRLLKENLTPKDKSPREIFDLQNTQDTFNYLIEETPKMDEYLIIKAYDMLMKNVDVREGYRTHEIRVYKSHFDATPAEYIKADMKILMRWYESNKDSMHPLVLSALFHQKFERIHPFSDGNGRTGRMLAIYILMSHSYPPLIIQKKNRGKYLDALADADKTLMDSSEPSSYKKLVSYFCDELVETYWNNFNI